MMSTINGSVHSIQEFFVRQKVKFKAKNVQTHIFEIWRHWMFLDVIKFPTGTVSNTMAFYTVLMVRELVIFFQSFRK